MGAKQAKIGGRQADASRISADAAMLTAQTSGNRAVASMRIKWVKDLRAVLSEYHSVLKVMLWSIGAKRLLEPTVWITLCLVTAADSCHSVVFATLGGTDLVASHCPPNLAFTTGAALDVLAC